MGIKSEKAKRQGRRTARFDDVQVESGALSELGKRVQVHGEKALAYQNKAEEVAVYELRKADEHLIARAQCLAEARSKCTKAGFKVFQTKYAPELSRSRLYELLAIGTGKKTAEQVKIATSERVAKHRAAKKSQAAPSVTQPIVTDEVGRIAQAAMDETPEPAATRTILLDTGNVAASIDDDAASSAERREAQYAAVDGDGDHEIHETGEVNTGRVNGRNSIMDVNAAPVSAKNRRRSKQQISSDNFERAIDHIATSCEVFGDMKLTPPDAEAAAWAIGKLDEAVQSLNELKSRLMSAASPTLARAS